MKKIFLICLVATFALIGCQRDSSQKSSDSSSAKQTVSKSSTSQKTELSSTTPASQSTTTTRAEMTSNSTTADSTTLSFSEATLTDIVAANEFGGYATFYFNGINVPDSININTNSNQVIFNPGVNNEAAYTLTMKNIPTRPIRVFSADNHEIRTVYVSTQLSVGEQLSGSYRPNNQVGVLYLFHNKHGSLSLATPNYAGNVPQDQADVMIEVLQ